MMECKRDGSSRLDAEPGNTLEGTVGRRCSDKTVPGDEKQVTSVFDKIQTCSTYRVNNWSIRVILNSAVRETSVEILRVNDG